MIYKTPITSIVMVVGKREVFCEVSMGSQEHRTPVVHTTLGAESRWNASMQFLVKDLAEDVLCVTVKDKGYFSPDGQFNGLQISQMFKVQSS